MNTTKTTKPVLAQQATTQAEARPAYEAPRITRKHSLERVTLTSGTFTPGGNIGGN
jgi:hypothetical protein